MASPNTSPSAVPPTLTISSPPRSTPSTSSSPPPSTSSTSSSPPPSTSPSSSTNSPPPTSQTNGTSDPPAAPVTPSTPSPPPNVPSAPPPSSPSPPPPDPSSTPPVAPPPAVPTPPPASPPPPPNVPGAPPPQVPATPPPAASPPPQPPPTPISPPPATPLPPVASPPPPPSAVSPSPSPPVPPPPPSTVPPILPPSSPPPPPPSVTPPENSPPPPSATPPENAPPPPSVTPPVSPGPRLASPPPHIPPPRSPPPPTNRPQPSPPPPSNPSSPASSPPPPTNSSGGSPSNPGVPSPTIPSSDPSGRSNNPSPTISGNSNSSGGSQGIGTGATVAIGAVAGLVVLSLIGLVVWLLRKQKKKKDRYNGGYVMPSPFGSSPKSDSSSFVKAHSSAPLVGSGSGSDFILSPSEPGGLGNSRSWFTYEELVKATNGFSTDNLLGEGGFGPVYKGCLSDGREVAVKQLKIGGSQGEREFRAEVEIISRVHHRHLVSLVGYCISENQRLLVYDYLPNNTLYYHLNGVDRPVMDWATRFKVAAGAARGIAYLHEDCHPRIIHRDIKSSNILLDYNFEARVSDFGLARLALDANTHVSTRVMGTFGYLAPEYASSGKLTEKSDVYSFGVVLLELITGRKPVDESQPLGDESLVEWARPLLGHALDNNGSERFEGLVDPRLENNYIEVEMFRMIEAAAACVRHSAVKRPRMGLVVRALDSVGDSSDLSNGMRPGQSEVFDSAQQSAEIRMFRRMAFGSQDYSTNFFDRTNFSSDHSRSWE